MKRQYQLCGLALSALLAVTSGCGAANNEDGVSQNNYRGHSVDPKALSAQDDRPPLSYRTVPDEAGEGQRSREPHHRVNDEQLATIAEGVPGVEHAKVLMNDVDVVVGIQVDDTGKRQIVEKQVYSALRWQYPEYNYHVTADDTLFEQIKTADSGAGRSGERVRMQALNDQMEVIIRAIARSMTRP